MQRLGLASRRNVLSHLPPPGRGTACTWGFQDRFKQTGQCVTIASESPACPGPSDLQL